MTTGKIVEWELESEWRSEDEIGWLMAKVNDLAREVENKIREAVIRIVI